MRGHRCSRAVKAQRKLKSQIHRKFCGFDSFDDGFKYFDERDEHPFFKEGDFVSSYDKVQRRLRKHPEASLIKGYFEESVAGKSVSELCGESLAAVVFIDCDLMGPARIALDFVLPALQPGTVLIIDDYFAYRGNERLGTCGALHSFLQENESVKVRQLCTYGYGGNSFIVTES